MNDMPSFEHLWADRLFRVPDATRISGVSRSKLFLLIAGGEVIAKREGNCNLILGASLGRYIDQLPTIQPSMADPPSTYLSGEARQRLHDAALRRTTRT